MRSEGGPVALDDFDSGDSLAFAFVKKLARLPSLPGNKTGVIPDWDPEAKKRRGPRCGNTQGPFAATGVLAAAELDRPASGPLRVCRTLSVA